MSLIINNMNKNANKNLIIVFLGLPLRALITSHNITQDHTISHRISGPQKYLTLKNIPIQQIITQITGNRIIT